MDRPVSVIDEAPRRVDPLDGKVPLSTLLVGVAAVHALAAVALVPASKVEGTRGRQIAIHGILTMAVALGALLIVVWVRRGRLQAFAGRSHGAAMLSFGVALHVVAAVVGATIGIAHGHAPLHLLGDTGQWLVTPVVALLVVSGLRRPRAVAAAASVIACFVLFQQARDGYEIFTVIGEQGARRLHAVFWVQALFAYSMFLGLALTARHTARAAVYSAAALMVAGIGLASGFRTFIALIAFVTPVAIFLLRPPARSVVRGLTLLVVIACAVFVVPGGERVVGPLAGPTQRITAKIGILFADDVDDVSATNRGAEYDIVMDQLLEQPSSFVVGRGNGAPVPLDSRFQVFDEEFAVSGEKHTIHNSFVGALFRTGLVGLVALVATLVGLLRRSYWLARTRRTPATVAVFTAACSFALAAQFFATIPGDFLFGAIVGFALLPWERADSLERASDFEMAVAPAGSR